MLFNCKYYHAKPYFLPKHQHFLHRGEPFLHPGGMTRTTCRRSEHVSGSVSAFSRKQYNVFFFSGKSKKDTFVIIE